MSLIYGLFFLISEYFFLSLHRTEASNQIPKREILSVQKMSQESMEKLK